MLTGLASVFFYVFAFILLVSASLVVFARNPVHSVLFLILAFFNAAALFLLAGAEFLAMILLIVYVGAVAVLFLFIVMMLDIDFAKLKSGLRYHGPIAGAIGLIFVIELVAVVNMPLTPMQKNLAQANAQANSQVNAQVNIKAQATAQANMSEQSSTQIIDQTRRGTDNPAIDSAIDSFTAEGSAGERQDGKAIDSPAIDITEDLKAKAAAAGEQEVVISQSQTSQIKQTEDGERQISAAAEPSNSVALGRLLYTQYAFYFELAGLILLVAMVGAIILTLRHKAGIRRQSITEQVARCPHEAIELRDVESGRGIS